MSTPANPLSLAHWRRLVAQHYADVRAQSGADLAGTASRFRSARARLFAEHSDSPIALADRARWRGPAWYPYDPAWRVAGVFERADKRSTFEIALSADGVVRCTRLGVVRFVAAGTTSALSLYWFEGYAGGLWLPFADATNGTRTYGGGRYLYDTIKGADLGATPDGFMLDFNFAYNPSCAFDDRWSCPLSPPENKLGYEVPAGEQVPMLA